MAIGFLRNSGTDSSREAIGFTRKLLEGSPHDTVKYVDDLRKKTIYRTSLTEFSGSAHAVYDR